MFKDGTLQPLLPQPKGVPWFSYVCDVVEGPLILSTQEPRSPHEDDVARRSIDLYGILPRPIGADVEASPATDDEHANEVYETQTVPMGSDADGALLVPLEHHRVEAQDRFEGICPQLSHTLFKQILKRVLEKNIAIVFRKIIQR